MRALLPLGDNLACSMVWYGPACLQLHMRLCRPVRIALLGCLPLCARAVRALATSIPAGCIADHVSRYTHAVIRRMQMGSCLHVRLHRPSTVL